MSSHTTTLLNHARDFKTRIIQKRRWILRQCEKNNVDAERYLEIYVFLEQQLVEEYQLEDEPLGWSIEVDSGMAFKLLDDMVREDPLDKVIRRAIQKRILDSEREKAEAEKERIEKEKQDAEREARRRERAKEREEAYLNKFVIVEAEQEVVTDMRKYMEKWVTKMLHEEREEDVKDSEVVADQDGFEIIDFNVTSDDEFEIIDF